MTCVNSNELQYLACATSELHATGCNVATRIAVAPQTEQWQVAWRTKMEQLPKQLHIVAYTDTIG